jgi:2-amino-4-hydroxy-6-hydroxymethyldihydropteridine diphosphokinase
VIGKVFIGIGSNLGDREANLFSAVDALRRMDVLAVTRCSSIYESAPIGPSQPRFLNAVIELECDLDPERLLALLKQLETDLGRQRRKRWGPREIDLDILLWDDRVVAEPRLQIPHLELHKRRFVVEPLCELAPDLRHPITGELIKNMLPKLTSQDVVKLHSVQPLLLAEAE